jgi:BlaI family penicillinase repressor
MKDIVSQYFNNSYPSMLAYFAKQEKISESELTEIIEIIKSTKK